MSSSIHYKFRTTNVSKTLAFDGQSIKVPELKKAICAAENIKAELFDLIFFNSFNKQPYSGDDEIPRNSSVTVQRVPIENGAKIPKISNPEISATTKAIPDVPDSAAHIKQEDFSKMTEEERIKHIRVQSTFKYTTNNYNRKPMANNMQQAPPDYLCNRCNQLGHFPKACPLLNIRKTTGIPNEELMETTADDPQAMLHPSGKFMIPIMHYKAREQRKLMEEQKKKGLTRSQEQKNKAVKKELPSELKCPLCNDIFKEALVTGCCGESFCADCIQQTMSDAIAADLNSQCPNCKAPIGASALFPNNSLRESVDKYKKSVAASLAAPEGSESEEDEVVTNAPESVSSPETSQQQNEKEEKTPERSVEVPSKVTAEVEKPVVLPTVNLSAMLAATQKPKQPSLPPPETVVNFSQPPPTVLSQPPVVVPIVDFSKPPPNFKLPDLSQPPPFIPSNIPKINKDVILPLPQSFNVPPPKPILSEPKYDEKDEEAINSVWEKLNVGDDNLDLATLFETRTSYVTPKDDESSAKEKDKEKRTKRHRSKSRERYRRENHKSRSRSPYQKHRSRSRSPHKKRKDSREREASSKKRSREPEYRHKSIEKRSSDRKDRERENGNGKEKERKEEKRKSDEQKESITPRDRERYRKYESDDDKKVPKPENELKRAVKYEKEIKKEKEREMKSMPKMHSESPKKKEVFNDNDEIKKASSSSQETLSRIEIKEREKEKEKKKDKVVKEKEREKPKDNGKEREKEKKKDKERDYIEKSEKKKSSKKDKTMDTVEREKEKKKSSIKEKKKSKSEEKKKKKRRKSSDRSDEDEEKQKKKRHKEKKHKKDRKRQRESIGGSDDDDSEDDRRKRRKF